MRSRERLKTVLSHGEPDRVPASPDISTLYCCKTTGKPFWEVLLNNDPPLWKLIVDIGRKQRFDTIIPCGLGSGPDDVPTVTKMIEDTENFKMVETTYHTSKGILTEQTLYPAHDSPWTKKPLVEDVEADYKKVISMFTDPWRKDTNHFNEIRKYLVEDGIVRSGGITVPTDFWLRLRENIGEGIMDYYSCPALMDKITQSYSEYALELVEANCRLLMPDLLLIGGSLASMSIISPDLYIKYDLPFLQKATAICKKYNVPSAVHMCGKCRQMLKIFANDTDLDMVEPLETKPGGNCDLKEVREKFGKKLCLKGNINTYLVLAKEDRDTVFKTAVKCIDDAKSCGGFILSSGDQVPFETPEGNLDMMVLAAERYGRY
jgi:uroporphyrinogen decarboxylase